MKKALSISGYTLWEIVLEPERRARGALDRRAAGAGRVRAGVSCTKFLVMSRRVDGADSQQLAQKKAGSAVPTVAGATACGGVYGVG